MQVLVMNQEAPPFRDGGVVHVSSKVDLKSALSGSRTSGRKRICALAARAPSGRKFPTHLLIDENTRSAFFPDLPRRSITLSRINCHRYHPAKPFNLRERRGQSGKSPVFRPVSLTLRVNGS